MLNFVLREAYFSLQIKKLLFARSYFDVISIDREVLKDHVYIADLCEYDAVKYIN